MESSPQKEKIDIDLFIKNLKIEEVDAFHSYLKDIWVDLVSREIEGKDKDLKTVGLSKILFDKYYKLPGMIGDRLFRVFSENNENGLSVSQFVNGFKTLFCGEYEDSLKFIFDFYDFNGDGKINKEDIRTVLSFLTLKDSPEIQSTGLNLTYKSRVTSQEELHTILQNCFKDSGSMDFNGFKNIIDNENSDLYLLIYLFLLQNKPFSKENLKGYIKGDIKKKKTVKVYESPSKLIASPSKTSNFSPYSNFNRRGKKRQTLRMENFNIEKLLSQDDDNKENKSPIKKTEVGDDSNYKRRKGKRNTVCGKNAIHLETFGDTDNKKIKEKRVRKLAEIKKRGIAISYKPTDTNEKDFEITPAFPMSKSAIPKNINSKNPTTEIIGENDVNFSSDSESDESNEDNLEGDEGDNEGEVIKYEGYLYKLVDGKMRKLWFKLVHKDLYYYKKKEDKNHKGLHNLSGLFLKEEKPKVCEGKTYYALSVVYPAKIREYYCDNEAEYKIWVEKLKIATDYTNLLDLYDVGKKLGSGKFGLVKLGINKKTHQKVAIKIMKKSAMKDFDLGLVRTEIEILKICQHPNIIRLYDVYENENYIYLIMEYCEGGDLFTYLEKRSFRVSEPIASVIMHKMCTAVFYMHEFGVAHRDLKPENVLMTSEDDDSDIRILDFGLSKIIGPHETCDEPYGTLTYCAPEIIIDEPYNKAVDLWSLGVMTYLMLTGRLPFNSRDENEISRQIVYDEPDYDKNSAWNYVSKDAKDFIKKLLQKDQHKRMNIKQALEHKFILNYSGCDLKIKRKEGSKEGESEFEIYSSASTV